ncbi:MAG: SCO family protein [Acidobacteriota bacterium]|jgi:protein SCO1/2|nr:SCO family protein [Acidobacteriota bacterium]MDQ3374205.1 SCO family protein [Acidobacteriota bacterium]
MIKSSDFSAVLKLTLLLSLFVLVTQTSSFAQKREHYNSPLYSPKTYDPTQTGVSNGLPSGLQKVGIEQKLNEQLPLGAQFKDENGNTVNLNDYFNQGKPVVLALVYYECPMLCNEVLNGLTGSLKGISFDTGKDFDVVAISFDARENDKPNLAKNKRESYLARYGRLGTEKGWHFLTGTQGEIDKVTDAVGFRYEFDKQTDQFAHAGGIMVLTPEGKVSRYLYGIDYAPKDLKFSLMESAESKIGNPVEKLFLYCYHYDPSTGKYGLAILSFLRLLSIATILGLGVMFVVFWRYNKNKSAGLK